MYSIPNKRLFKWQEECLDKWFANNCRGVASIATGAGKTILALAAVYNLAARNPSVQIRIKIVVPKIFLARQWCGEIIRELGTNRQDIGLYYGAVKEDHEKPVVIYVLNTARYCISRHILRDIKSGSSVFLICDECHHFASRENARVFDFLPHIPPEKYYALGLSATPDCDGFNEVIVPSLGKVIHRYGLADATHDNVTAGFEVFNIAVNFMPDESADYEELSDRISLMRAKLNKKIPSLPRYRGKQYFRRLKAIIDSDTENGAMAKSLLLTYYQRKDIVYRARARIMCGCELVRRLINDKRIIVFTERIEMADELFYELSAEYPGQICRYHSEMHGGSKQDAIERFRVGAATVLICCRALDEGLNVTETDVGIVLSSSYGERQRVQRTGRVLRKSLDGKLKSLYYMYVQETSEPTGLLSDHEDAATYNLCYDEELNSFRRSEYDDLSAVAKAEFLAAGASARQLANVEKQLSRGIVRNDYMLPESDCKSLIDTARVKRVRDYWITMRCMARLRERCEQRAAAATAVVEKYTDLLSQRSLLQ